MRLLNTWTGKFEWHHDPKEVRYAILSHVWQTPEEGGEQSFAEVQQIQADVEAAKDEPGGPYPAHWPIFDTMKAPFPYDTSEIFSHSTRSDILYAPLPDGASVIFSPESPLSNKIKGLCKVARDAGFNLVWNDTCCIDKSSSAELSEAINSMYEWYRLSDMCYVYLADVPDSTIPSTYWRNRFGGSKWHKRGWTLQELIAPERIEFLTRTWRCLGTKLGLADTLARINQIDIDILLGRAPVDSASVAQRMSWAAQRKTTRVEDQAYSLMGLFGVHMSPIYGEGTNAFHRLQEEVIRAVPDQSTFAWGKTLIFTASGGDDGWACHANDTNYYAPSLLAPSLDPFLFSTVRPVALSDFASRLGLHGLEDVPPLDCVFAPQGARVRLLCLDMTDPEMKRPLEYARWFLQKPPCRHGPSSIPRAERLALLQCEDEEGSLVALPIYSSDAGHGSLIGTHNLCTQSSCSSWKPYRTFLLPQGMLAEILKGVKLEMVEVCFLSRCQDPRPPKFLHRLAHSEMLPALDLWSGDCPDGVAFSLSPDSVANLQMLGVTASPLLATREGSRITLETTLALRNGDLHSTKLGMSIERLEPFWTSLDDEGTATQRDNVKFYFVASSASLTTDLVSAVPGSDSEQIHECTDIVASRYTLAQCDFLIRTCPEWPELARTLRVSLARSPEYRTYPPTSSRAVFLVFETSEGYEHTPEANRIPENPGETATEQADSASEEGGPSDVNSDSAAPLAPSHFSDVVYPPTNARTKQCAALEERVDALGQENSALRAQVSAVAEQMKSEVAVLASQNTALAEKNAALSRQNAALEAQMAAVWRRLDALAAPTTAMPSPPARMDAT